MNQWYRGYFLKAVGSEIHVMFGDEHVGSASGPALAKEMVDEWMWAP